MDPSTFRLTLMAALDTATYWIATVSGPDLFYCFGVALAPNGGAYISGYGQPSAYVSALARISADGDLVWQRKLTDGGEGPGFYRATSTSSGDVYAAGFAPGAGAYDCLLAKYNSSGTLQWQRSLGSSNTEYLSAVATDGTSVYVGNIVGTGLIAKYNSSGALQWQRTIGGNSYFYGSTVDATGDIYFAGGTTSGGLIVKYNSSGVIQWQRTLAIGYFNGIAVDADLNAYCTGFEGTSLVIAKYNSSGVIQWQRTLSASDGYDITVAPSGFIYVTGATTAGKLLVAKYNTSGTLQWQRTLYDGSLIFGNSIIADNSDNLYCSCQLAGQIGVLVKIPGDGSLTGTYGTWSYDVASFTDASSSYADSASTLSETAASLTDVAATGTDSSASYSIVKTEL